MRRPRMCRVSSSSLSAGSPLGKLKLSYVPKGERALVLVGVSDPDGSALILVVWIRIRIGNSDSYPGGQKGPQKYKKVMKFCVFEVLDALF
jgi:hypothetical protein